jgi:hypothetical protein
MACFKLFGKYNYLLRLSTMFLLQSSTYLIHKRYLL